MSDRALDPCRLPLRPLLEIASHLNSADCCRCDGVSRLWQAAFRDDRVVRRVRLPSGRLVVRRLTGPPTALERTLRYYNDARNARAYAERSASADLSAELARFTACLRAGAFVVDLGCGPGRDLEYFAKRGFVVLGVDPSERMCDLARRRTGLPVLCDDARHMRAALPERADGVWACASLLHVPRDQLLDTLRELALSLLPGGVLYASFKHGRHEGVDALGRHETCMDAQLAGDLLQRAWWFRTLDEPWVTGDAEGRAGVEWFNLLLAVAHEPDHHPASRARSLAWFDA